MTAIGRNRAIAALFLFLSFSFVGPLWAQATSQETLLATAEADTRRNKALARIDGAIVEITPAAREGLTESVKAQIDSLLRPVQQSVETAKQEIDSTVGFWDGLSSARQEQRITQALQKAQVEQSVSNFALRLQERIAGDAGAIYDEYFAKLNQILREEIADPLGPRVGANVFDKLSHDLKQAATSRFQELQAPDAGGVEGLPVAIPLAGAAAIAIRRMIMSRLGNQLARRLAGSLIGRALGRAATAFAISPGKASGFGVVLDIGVAILTLLATIIQGGQATRDALKEKMDEWYQVEIRLPLVEKSNIDIIVTSALEGVEEQLRLDRTAAANLIERTYAGVIAQTKSPGFAEFSARSDDETLGSATFAVPSVFGAEHVEVDYAVKLDLVRRITPVDKARLLVQRYGRRFIDLFQAYPGDVAAVANATDAVQSFGRVLSTDSPDDELLFFRRAIDGLGALDGPQTTALVLVRTLLPARPAEQIPAPGLARVTLAVGPLAQLASSDPQDVTKILGWLLDSALAPQTLGRILGRPDTPKLVGLLVTLEPLAFEALLGVAAPDQLGAYLEEVPPDQALAILRSDGPTSLVFYQFPESGGWRAVQAREKLRQEMGRVDSGTSGTLRWVLAHTDLPAGSIDLQFLRNLQAVGISGALWPDAVAVPAARLIAWIGLTIPLLVLACLVALPMLAWWLRLFPGRRRPPPVVITPAHSYPTPTSYDVQGGLVRRSGGQPLPPPDVAEN